MKILLCPDKFKGSLTAQEVCDMLREGIHQSLPKTEVISHPIADGGDGSIRILYNRLNLHSKKIDTIDPLGRKIQAEYAYSDNTAFIELASASGLVLLNKTERNPLITSTRGTGYMIKDALENGFKKIYLFIGGSATNDAGIGLAQALGFNFMDQNGHQLDPVGMHLINIEKIENSSPFDFTSIEITVLCDVTNPMYGPEGAAYTYARQKGGSSETIKKLDDGLRHFNTILCKTIDRDISSIQGMGAAGAVGASLSGLLNAKLIGGFQLMSEITGLEEAIKSADVVITGEGKIDHTSYQGKVVGNVLSLCQKHHTPCGVVGGVVENANSSFLFTQSIISKAIDIEESMHSPKKYLKKIGQEIGDKLKNL